MRFTSNYRNRFLIAWVLYGLFLYRGGPSTQARISFDENKVERIGLWVVGEIHRPGAYQFAPKTTVLQAIESAGGATDYADLSRLNLSVELLPNTTLQVPSTDYGFENVIILNRSCVQELTAIPGIGPELAGRIVREREENGPFERSEDLLRVSGIGKKKLRVMMQHAFLNRILHE